MLRMLLIPNWTEKPTAPSAITAPAATPNPTAWISVCSTPEGSALADELEHLGAGDRADRGAGAPVGVEDARGEVAGRVVVLVEGHLPDDPHVLDRLALAQGRLPVREVVNHGSAGLRLQEIGHVR